VLISIIVPAFNEEKLLGASLAEIKSAAAAFTARGWQVELVVCDNNSTDRTPEIARAAGAKVVFEPVNQIARARNCGALAASGNWLVFVDADSHPSAGLFADVAEQILVRRSYCCRADVEEAEVRGGDHLRDGRLEAKVGPDGRERGHDLEPRSAGRDLPCGFREGRFLGCRNRLLRRVS